MLGAFAAQLTAAVRNAALARDAAAADGARRGERPAHRDPARPCPHDLRTPLGVDQGGREPPPATTSQWTADERAEFLATIEEETDRLTELVGNLLDMSRIQAGGAAV